MLKISSLNSRKIIDEIRKDLKQELTEFGSELLKNIKQFTPYKQGRAREGWNKTETNNAVKVKNMIPYIERLNENYSKQTRGRGIVTPAIARTKANRQRSIR